MRSFPKKKTPRGAEVVRFLCEINMISDAQIISIWDSIGVRAAIADIQDSRERIRFYAEFNEDKKQYPKKFQSMIETRGARILGEVNPCGAGLALAATAYLSVLNGTGRKMYHRQENFNPLMIRHTQTDMQQPEFDVVKKRRAMDTASTPDSSGADETCPEALQRFEEFEAHVLDALMEIENDDKETRYSELIQMEQDLCSGVLPTSGGVYVAVSKAVKYPKIGATRRSDPAPRLRELSRYVPSPFEVVFWVPTLTPFKTESEIHRHFAALRIKERGACTEFFKADLAVIGAHLKANYLVMEKTTA